MVSLRPRPQPGRGPQPDSTEALRRGPSADPPREIRTSPPRFRGDPGERPRWHPAQLLILAFASVLVAAVSGMVFGITTSLLLHLPTPTSVPDCPAGTTLYTRTILLGKALVPIQHCFRETDAQDPQP